MRTTKRFVYIVGAIIVIGGIIWVGRILLFPSAASCSDGRQNQGEEGVDCGGPCVPCALQNVQDIQIRWAQVIPLSTGISLAAEIYNPNSALAAQSFDYTFSLINQSGGVEKEIQGSSFIYGGELKYLSEPFVDITAQQNSSVQLTIKNIKWIDARIYAKPNIEAQDIKTTFDKTVLVSGSVVSHDEATFANVRVVALLFDANSKFAGVSRTLIDEVPKFESKPFQITFPDSLIIKNVAPDVSLVLYRTLKEGDVGEDVGTLQVILGEIGLYQGNTTNTLDAKTSTALKLLQEQFNLEQSGVFDEATRSALIKTLSEGFTQIVQDKSGGIAIDPTKTKVFVEAQRQ